MRTAHILVVISIICTCVSARAGTVIGKSDTLRLGARPFYGLVFGDYGNSYSNAPGFMIGAQGGFQVNADNKLMLYPEFCWGFYYLAHKSESNRRLMLFPFAVNMIFDIKALRFFPRDGALSLKPYVGLGVYLNDYKSDRKSAIAGDFGYQAGIILEFTHARMENAYVEARINHMGSTNFAEFLPTLDFSVGAGYAIALKTKPASDTGRDGKPSLKIKIQ